MATTTARANGQVKWFNNKAGYGFITVTEGVENTERDIFVHHTEVQVGQAQYKYLVQGEYVSFVITPVEKENYQVHATQVSGVNGGKLMCETRNEARSTRVVPSAVARPPRQQQQTQAVQQTQVAPQRQARPPRQQTQTPVSQQQTQPPVAQQTELRRPQLDKADQAHWKVVPLRQDTTTSQTPMVRRKQPRQRQPEIELS